MKSILKGIFKLFLALSLALMAMWFVLSFNWSRGDMSVIEQVFGIVYTIMCLPAYYAIKRVLRLG